MTSPRRRPTKAKEQPLGLKVSKPQERLHHGRQGRRLLLRVRARGLPQRPGLRQDPRGRAKIWNQGGLTIRTTLDPQAQELGRRSRSRTTSTKSDKVAAAATLVEPGTGKIVGDGPVEAVRLRQERDRRSTTRSTRPYGGSNYGFPTGSTFKPFVAAAALEEGTPGDAGVPVAVRDGRTRARSRPAAASRGPNQRRAAPWRTRPSPRSARTAEGGDGEVGQHLLRPDDLRHRHCARWST